MGLIALSQVRPHLAMPRVRSLILAFDLGVGRAVLAHSGRCFSTPWDAPEREVALAGIGATNDVPVARRLMVCRESEHRLKRDVPVKAAIIAEDKLVEIRVDMFAAQAVIRAKSPPLH